MKNAAVNALDYKCALSDLIRKTTMTRGEMSGRYGLYAYEGRTENL